MSVFGRPGKSILTVIVLAMLAAATQACGGDGERSLPTKAPNEGVERPENWLIRAQDALAELDGYTITVTGHNLVLPQWGGIDSGKIEISTDGPRARAELLRTGDGDYTMIWADAQTFFQRSTCDRVARVPGGGVETLLPFLWTERKILETAENPRYAGSTAEEHVSMLMKLQYLGEVRVDFDPVTDLPSGLFIFPDPVSNTETAWRFGDFESKPEIEKPAGDITDQGPGGNPC